MALVWTFDGVDICTPSKIQTIRACLVTSRLNTLPPQMITRLSLFIQPKSVHHHRHCHHESLYFSNLGFWRSIVQDKGIWGGENRILTAVAEAPGPTNDAPASTLVLAEQRTKRPDILDNFCRYQGGWDIANKHYWVIGLGWTEAAMIAGAREAALAIVHCCRSPHLDQPSFNSSEAPKFELISSHKVNRCRLRASKVVDLSQIVDFGVVPYPHKFHVSMSVLEYAEEYGGLNSGDHR
ncbi:hypothetical protein LguiB_008770 [Lonicera macranthoides]